MAGLIGSSGNLNIGAVGIVADHAYEPGITTRVPQGYTLLTGGQLGMDRDVPSGTNLEFWKNDSTGSIMVGVRGSLTKADFDNDTQIFETSTPNDARNAANYIADLARLYPSFQITITGHSYGGYVSLLSQALAQDSGLENVAAVAINPLGLNANELTPNTNYNSVTFYATSDPAVNISILKGLVIPGQMFSIDNLGPDAATTLQNINKYRQSEEGLLDSNPDASLGNFERFGKDAFDLGAGFYTSHESKPFSDRLVEMGRLGMSVNDASNSDTLNRSMNLAATVKASNQETQDYVATLVAKASAVTSWISWGLGLKEKYLGGTDTKKVTSDNPYSATVKNDPDPTTPEPKAVEENRLIVDIENKPVEENSRQNDNSSTFRFYNYGPDEALDKVTTEKAPAGQAPTQEDVFVNGTSAIKYLDTPQNTHPYTNVEIFKDADGKPTAVNTKIDGQTNNADFSGIGQVLGSTLGRALAPNNQFVQIAASTVLGVAGQKLALVFFSQLSTNATKVDLSTAFSTFGPSVAAAGAGAAASFLIAELGNALGLSGFQAQMFNTTVGGLASGVASKIAADIFSKGLSFADAIGALQWGDAVTGAIGNIGPNIASLLGSYLAHELVPAQTHAGAVGGQLLGAIGSVVGIALGNAIGGVLNFIIPGVGSLIGTILGTLLGDAFGSTPHPAAIDLVDQAGYLYGFTHYQVSASDGGDYSIPDPMAAGTVSIINGYLTAVKGIGLDHSKQITIGYMTDPSSLYINGVPGHVNSSFVDANDAVHAAALDALQHTEVIGGDLLMKRAHQNSTANIPGAAPGGGGLPGQEQTSGAQQLVTLGGDLNIANDYANYLNNRVAINALMAANPNTAFAAGWIATFVRVNELGLNRYGASDFGGGLVGFLDSVQKAGLADTSSISVKQGSNGSVTIELHVAGDREIPGSLSVFADQVNEIDDETGVTLQFVFNDGLAAGGFHALGSNQGDTGKDLWFGGGTFNAVTGSGDDILVGGASNDTIDGGTGWDFIDGGAGNDVLLGEEGGDILHGGSGVDNLQGGGGDDTYVFNRGDGADTAIDNYTALVLVPPDPAAPPSLPVYVPGHVNGGADSLRLGTGISASDVRVQLSGANLIVGVRNPANPNIPFDQLADRITLQNWTDPLDRIETLRLADGTTLSLAAIVAAGNGGDDFIAGVPGANAIDGGIGNDTVSYASSTAAVAIALGGSLGAGGDAQGDAIINVETLIGSNFNDTLVGDSRNNTLIGGAGSDYLDGVVGADVMLGGTGDDVYVVDSLGDVVVENAGEGADAVASSISYVLDANVEGLTLTGSAVSGIGNELANVINGNERDNILYGDDGGDTLYGYAGDDTLDGGAGADWMAGGTGNDTYVVDGPGDVVTENAGEGIDTVRSSATSFTLSGNVENLMLVGRAYNGTGNAADNVITGNTGDNVLDGGTGADTMLGGRGDDTYVVENAGDVVTENAGEGTDIVWSQINYTLGDNVENLALTGSAVSGTGNAGNNAIIGNNLDNVLVGGAGNDILDGGTGADTMIGGTGNDTYVVDNVGDVVVENAGEGTDTIVTSASTTLSGNIENLTLTGTAAINGTGDAGNNVIVGNSGDNVLDGGTGADAMLGGLGNDAYVVDNAGDVVTENAGEGTDIVWSQVNYTLGSNVENLVLTGAATSGTGNAADNVIYGNGLDNVLDGATGADTMLGGLGNDVYVVDNAGDVVVENTGEGIDTVYSSISTTLGANVENLVLVGSMSISGAGNAVANVISGNGADNFLSGGGGDDALYGNAGNDTLDGGTGADAMVGGTGDDTYIVDDAGDYEAENAGEGFDTVRASVSYTLGQNTEGLTLTGSDAIDGFGSADNNVMVGNSGDNNLFGAEGTDTLYGEAGNDTLDGGPGADTMFGGTGDDRFVVDDPEDVVMENPGEGTDVVWSSISYALVGNVENLTLTDVDAIDGFGNDLNNVMTGNAGDNSLFGAEGADTLIGGAGNDRLDGGPGADTMLGGVGDDLYAVDSADDVVMENEGEGTDVVWSSISSYTLGANVENLKLTDVDVISGTGNALDNVITGSDGNNILTGLGGSDTLYGGIGTDTAVYTGHRADYAVSWNGETHNLTITDQRSNSPDGSDTANSIEILQFSDGSAEYDDQGRLTRSTLISGDGSRAVTNYDADGSQPWSVQLLNYDSIGNLHTFSQNEDDGTLTVTQYDVDENRSWTSYTSTFNNDGRLTALNVAYDDTTSLVTNYDITDIASWSAQTGAGGPGTQSINIVDTGDAFEWANYTNVVSSGGSLLTQAGTLDNEGHWLNAYDTTNAFTWTSYFNSYNTDGELTWQSGNQDNGTHWLTVFDTSGTHSWSQATVAFDADYNQMAIGGINDDGSHLIAIDEFNPALDLVGWSPFAYIPTQHLWPQSQIWGASVAENAAPGTLVGTVAGALDDGGTVLNFTMTNDAGGKFVIDAGTGEVTVANGAHFNYEGASFHTIQVRTTDASGEVSDKTFTVTVTDVNEAPTNITLTGGTVDENADNGTVVGTALGIDQDAGSTFSYALTNNASGRFAINATTGVVTVANGAQLDYEAASSHQITVRTTDQGGLTFDKAFTIALNDLNEAPTNATLSANTVVENAANGTVVGTVTGVDQDAGSILTYTLASDEGPFAIDATTGVVTVQNHFQLDYESSPVEAITVNVTDQGGLSLSKNFFINLTDVNEAPIAANMTGGTVAENSAIGTLVGTVSGFDVDAGSVLSYSLVNNAGKPFAINATTGAVTVASGTLDYETTHSQSITVRTTDQGGLYLDQNFNITLTDANDAPTNATLTGGTVAENSDNGTVVGTVAGVDPDAVSTFSYSLTNNAGGRFAINASTGVVTVANGALLDYETAASHQITVRTTDQGGLTFDKSFTIGLTDVNEAPTNATLSASTVVENAANGTVVGTVAGIDPDAGSTFTYTLASDEGPFAINATTGVVTVQNHFQLDYESSPVEAITVNVTDQGGLTLSKNFFINLTDVNEAPLAANMTGGTVAENSAIGTVVGTVAGFDLDAGSVLSYSLINNAGKPFAINATTGAITVASGTLDYETTHSQSITVRTTDQGSLYLDQNFNITLTDANDAPTNATLTGGTVAENSANGTVVGTVAGVDPDAVSTLSYSLTNNAGGRFAINATTGVVTVANGALLDYETAASHQITVRTTDQGGLTFDKSFTIGLTDVNDAPTGATLSSTTVAENSANGTVVGTVTGIDPDAGTTFHYSLASDEGPFAINATTGVLTVQNHFMLDYEGSTTQGVTVNVFDQAGLYFAKGFTINVTDVNEAPLSAAMNGNTVVENAAIGTLVGTVSGFDVDAGTTLSYSLINNAGKPFAINATTGAVTVASGTLDYETTHSQSITVRTTDQGGLYLDQNFNITLTDANDAPTNATLTGGTVAENSANGTVVGTIAGVDPDAVSTLSYSLTNNASGRFAINASTGVVTVANGALLDYETAASHQITVRTTDQGGLTFDKSFTIGLTNVNDAPTNSTLTGGTVAENASNGTVVGTVAGVDPDAGSTLSYSLTNNAGGRFAINATTGVVTVANGALLDYEAASSQQIVVRTTDQGGLTFDKTFTIALTNVNEAPTNATLTGGTVAENSANGTVVGTVAGVDPDAGSTFSYALTNNASGRFAINATTGVVTVANGALLDYEAATSHQIVVRTTDQGGLTFDKTFTIGLTNVNEAPTNSTLTGGTVAENAGNGTVVGTVAGSDPDAGSTFSYSLTNNAGGRFAINATTGVVTVANGALLDYEAATSQQIVARTTDQGGLTFDKTFTIGLTNVNEAPTNATLTGNTVVENAANGTVIGTAAGVDPDAGTTFHYSLANTEDAFAINATTGVVTVQNRFMLDYESTPTRSITVNAFDQAGLYFAKAFTINLTNVNEAPLSASMTGGTVAENAAVGTLVGTVSGFDMDAGSVLSYSLINNAGKPFAINATTGAVTVAAGTLNYEATTTQSITARVTDQGGLYLDQNFNIALTNVNEAPTNSTMSGTSIREHSAANTAVGTVTGVDPDAGSALTYSLTNDAGGRFSINASTGLVSVANGNLLDYATAHSYNITVRTTDQGGLNFDKAFTIAITPATETINNPNGTSTVTLYDVYNNYGWKSFRSDYSAANGTGTLLYQLGTFDGNSTWQNFYDTANTQNWSYHVDVTDNAGHLISQTGTYDNGSHWLIANDPANSASWSTFTMIFDSDWNATSISETNDDGSHTPDEVWGAFDTLLWYSSPYVVSLTPGGGGGGDGLPVVLDLDGNGIDITPLDRSSTAFAMDDGPGRIRTAWVGGNDGLLAIDLGANGASGPDGVIDQTKEIVFTAWAPGSSSDMAALRQVFDTNHDGRLDLGDDRWSDFRIWQDANSDGISQAGEVRSLADRGVASVDLTPSGSMQILPDGSRIQGTSAYTRLDGSTGLAGDVAFAVDPGLRQLIQAMATHSADSGAISSPTAQTPSEFHNPAMLAPPH